MTEACREYEDEKEGDTDEAKGQRFERLVITMQKVKMTKKKIFRFSQVTVSFCYSDASLWTSSRRIGRLIGKSCLNIGVLQIYIVIVFSATRMVVR